MQSTTPITTRSGQLVDATGQRIRFIGITLPDPMAIPSQAEARLRAQQLHQAGINLVCIQKLDRAALEKFDFFVSQLKEKGIFIQLVLETPLATLFEPAAFARQSAWITQLLTHKNPHTGLSLAQDPVLALFQLLRKGSLIGAGQPLAMLSPETRRALERPWQQFLRERYPTTAQLHQAWKAGGSLGAECLSRSPEHWALETPQKGMVPIKVLPPGGKAPAPEGPVLELAPQNGQERSAHLHQSGLTLEPGRPYTLTFTARAAAPRPLTVNLQQGEAPWSNLGLDATVALTSQWQSYRLTFVASPEIVPAQARLSFLLTGSPVPISLGDWSLRPGIPSSPLGPGESLETGDVSLGPTDATRAGMDFLHFLMAQEDSYLRRRTRQIRALGSRALIACAPASEGGIGGAYRESKTDWVPAAAHMGESTLETLTTLAGYRVQGKPFIAQLTEPLTPANLVAAIGYAAWQDWDGILLPSLSSLERLLPLVRRLFGTNGLAPAPTTLTLTVPKSRVAGLQGLGTERSFWSLAQTRFVQGSLKFAPERASQAAFLAHRVALRFESDSGPVALGVQTLQAPGEGLIWDTREALLKLSSPTCKALTGALGGRATRVPGLSAELAPAMPQEWIITLSALDGKPTELSENLQLYALGLPATTLHIATAAPKRVWALDASGKPSHELASVWENGTLTLALEKASPLLQCTLLRQGDREPTR